MLLMFVLYVRGMLIEMWQAPRKFLTEIFSGLSYSQVSQHTESYWYDSSKMD